MLRGDTRSLTTAVQDLIDTTMERIVAGICAAANGASYEFSYQRNFIPTVNTAGRS